MYYQAQPNVLFLGTKCFSSKQVIK